MAEEADGKLRASARRGVDVPPNDEDEVYRWQHIKAQVVQDLSHELRTPLTYIKGYVELLLEGELGPLNDEQRRSLEIVNRKTDEVISVVSEITSLHRLGYRVRPVPLLVKPVLEQIVALLRARMEAHRIRVHITVEGEHLQVCAGPDEFRQLCYHLLDNAVGASPEGGEISVRAAPEDEAVHLYFQAQAFDIPAGMLYYQDEGPPKRRIMGLGRGMVVVQRIVAIHGGKVWVEEKESEGYTVHILLPRYSS